MSILNMRYNGNIISLSDESFNFNPQNYGTARLNIKANSNSTMKFGLTTNTNAQEYCKMQMRINGQVAYIGRISSTEYNIGNNVNYNGSVVGSRLKSTVTNNSNSGSGTLTTNPTIQTITNSSGSTVTTMTASENVAVKTLYSMTIRHYTASIQSSQMSNFTFPALGNNKVYSQNYNGTIISNQNFSRRGTYVASNSTLLFQYRGTRSSITTDNATYYTSITMTPAASIYSTTITTTRSIVTLSSTQTVTASGGDYLSVSKHTSSYGTISSNSKISYTYGYSTYTTGKSLTAYARLYTCNCVSTSYFRIATSIIRLNSYYRVTSYGAIASYISSSKRWSYTWTSCKQTIKVSETLHNMNL